MKTIRISFVYFMFSVVFMVFAGAPQEAAASCDIKVIKARAKKIKLYKDDKIAKPFDAVDPNTMSDLSGLCIDAVSENKRRYKVALSECGKLNSCWIKARQVKTDNKLAVTECVKIARTGTTSIRAAGECKK